MLDLGKNNIFTGSQFEMSSVISFFELIGRNQILFHKENSTFKHYIKIKKVKYTSRLEEQVLENLFRIDTIIIEDDNIYSLYNLRKITDLPIVLIRKKLNLIQDFSKIDKVYNFSKNQVEDTIQKCSYSLNELKKQWIRDRKIKDIFNIS